MELSSFRVAKHLERSLFFIGMTMASDDDDSYDVSPSLQAVLAAAGRVGGGVVGVGVVSSCAHATDVLREQASRAGLRLLHVLQVDDESDITKKITHFINNNMVRVFLSITISASVKI